MLCKKVQMRFPDFFSSSVCSQWDETDIEGSRQEQFLGSRGQILHPEQWHWSWLLEQVTSAMFHYCGQCVVRGF